MTVCGTEEVCSSRDALDHVQDWETQEVVFGDLVSVLSLVPAEVLTIEIHRTRRTLLEESRETASTVEQATEQTTVDKESINIANTASRTENWGISGKGQFSLSGIGAEASYTDQKTIDESIKTTTDQIREATVRSSVKVSTQTKIQVRGLSHARRSPSYSTFGIHQVPVCGPAEHAICPNEPRPDRPVTRSLVGSRQQGR